MFEIKLWINEKMLVDKKENNHKINWYDFSGCLYFYNKGYLYKSTATGKPLGFGYWVLTDIWSLTQAYLEYPKNRQKIYDIGELTSFKLISDGEHLFFVMIDKSSKSEFLRFRIKEHEFLGALIRLSENVLEIVGKWGELSDEDIVKTIKEKLSTLKQKQIKEGIEK